MNRSSMICAFFFLILHILAFTFSFLIIYCIPKQLILNTVIIKLMYKGEVNF